MTFIRNFSEKKNAANFSKKLNLETFENQFHSFSLQVYDKGAFIFLPNEDSQKIYFIKNGNVKIGNYGTSGKEITKNILEDGEVFGEAALMENEGKRRDFAIATTKTTVYTIKKDDLLQLIKKHPELMIFILKTIGQKKLEMERRLESLYFKDSRARVIEFLYKTGVKTGEKVGFETVVRKHMTHQEIANLTATSRQTVTTVLNELRSRNLITFNRRRFLIRNMEALGQEGLVAV